MRNFVRFWNEAHPTDPFPDTPTVSSAWFAERGLPLVVSCACCEMTMALPSAYISDDEYCYCATCAGVE